MGFGGNFGAAASMTPIGIISAPSGILTYNADGISVDLQKNGDSSAFAVREIDNLRITGGAGTVLAVFIAAGDGSSGDRGTLVSGAPGANEHGIPANFGPGRGSWTQEDVERFRASIHLYQSGSLADASIGQAVVQSIILAAGDISVLFRNISLATCIAMQIDLEYLHTINLG